MEDHLRMRLSHGSGVFFYIPAISILFFYFCLIMVRCLGIPPTVIGARSPCIRGLT